MAQIPSRQLFIGGQWVAPAQGGSLPVINPATEQEIGRIAAATPADVDRAVAAAVATAKSGTWKTGHFLALGWPRGPLDATLWQNLVWFRFLFAED
jgi:hypothetical protein